jgi:uncharacterized membrane protein YdbT with pleckstrin-like domain
MPYVDENLNPGELVEYQTRLHWIVLFEFSVAAFVLGFTGLVVVGGALFGSNDSPSGMATMGVAIVGIVLMLLAAGLMWLGTRFRAATEMAVTNRRIIAKRGLLSTMTIELFLKNIESVRVEQGMLGLMLGYGDVVLRGTGGTRERFTNMDSPLEFRRQAQLQIEAFHKQS